MKSLIRVCYGTAGIDVEQNTKTLGAALCGQHASYYSRVNERFVMKPGEATQAQTSPCGFVRWSDSIFNLHWMGV